MVDVNIFLTIYSMTNYLLLLVLSVFITSCGGLSSEVDKKLEELNNKARSLDSLVNQELDKVQSLDSLVMVEADKVKQLDSLVEKSTGRLDSMVNEKVGRLKN